ncbi:hypothetical protein RI367_005296 [Sorochytrium milnesiophthora]
MNHLLIAIWGWCGTTQAHCAAGCQSNCWSGGQPQPPLLPPPQLQVPPAEPAFGGDGTWYNPSVGTGACGWFNADTELVAAMNAPQYGSYGNPNDSAVCGKCAHVCGPNGCVTVKIVDRCPPCIQGSLDLSPAAFASIADPTLGRIHINWNFVDC